MSCQALLRDDRLGFRTALAAPPTQARWRCGNWLLTMVPAIHGCGGWCRRRSRRGR
jgi:hypothetical protein